LQACDVQRHVVIQQMYNLLGHGMVDRQGDLYLVCTDYENKLGYTEEAVKQYGLPVWAVLQIVEAAKRAVVVFDAWRRTAQPTGHVMDVHAVGNALVVYSCAPNGMAFDGFLDGKWYLSHLVEV